MYSFAEIVLFTKARKHEPWLFCLLTLHYSPFWSRWTSLLTISQNKKFAINRMRESSTFFLFTTATKATKSDHQLLRKKKLPGENYCGKNFNVVSLQTKIFTLFGGTPTIFILYLPKSECCYDFLKSKTNDFKTTILENYSRPIKIY